MQTHNGLNPHPRGADTVIQALAQAGIKRIFALSGNQIMPLFDACFEAGIEVVHTRHEAACVYMAEAHAQLTGQLGVAMVTAGVGLGNAVGPLFCASESDSPVLLLSGDSPLAQDGSGAFQEMPQVEMTAPVTRFSARPDSPASLADALLQACGIATSERPGPVHLALAADLLEGQCDGIEIPRPHTHAAAGTAKPETVQSVIDVINAARRPLILFGPSLNGTRQPGLLRAVTHATGVPTAVLESPRGLRDPGYQQLGAAIDKADTVVLLGKRCDFSLAFGGTAPIECNWCVIDGDASRLAFAERNLPAEKTTLHHADPLAIALSLSHADLKHNNAAWRTDCARWLAPMSFANPGTHSADALHPAAVCNAVQSAIEAAKNPILIIDGGEFGQWAQAICSAPRRIVNGVAGSIGGGIPQAIAASLTDPSADVFALMGDGSAGFHLSELETAVRCGARLSLVIGNDQRWNAEHQIQLRQFGPSRLFACELGDTDYAAVARGFGAEGERVHTTEALAVALNKGGSGVRCIDVAIDGLAAPEPVEVS